MRRVRPVLAIPVLVLAALGVLAAVLGRERGGAPREESLRGRDEGATLSLEGVDFREIRPGGEEIRFRSARASYSILAHHLSAEDATVSLPAPAGAVVVTAARASWNMDSGIVLLPAGGRADGAQGWSASVPDARVDLKAGELTASDASLTGPGVVVEGRDLVWKWNDGTMTMDAARGRVLPGKVVRRHG